MILGLNKADQQSEDNLFLDNSYRALAVDRGWTVAKFSALTEDGLESLQQSLIQKLRTRPLLLSARLGDRPARTLHHGRVIREQILLLTREEVPHSVAIGIERVQEEDTITRVWATVFVERPSQKGIVIGKGGSMLQEIGTAARQQMQKLIDGKVYLELFVKVQPKWRQSRTRLAELGYRVEE